MKNVKEILKKHFHLVFLLIMLVIILFIAGYLFMNNSNQKYASETWVREVITAYSGDNLTELDIKVLEKNLTTQIDDKIEEIDFEKELTEEQLVSLMAMVNEELQYADYSISQEEISTLTTAIVKRILSENLLSTDLEDQYAAYEIKIETLENEITVLRNSLEKLSKEKSTVNTTSTITAEQVRAIAKESGLSEAQVKNWIEELEVSFEESLEEYEDAFQNLSRELGVDAETLKMLTEQAAETEDSISYLTTKLGITEERLNDVLSKIDVSRNAELLSMYNSLKASQEDLKEQVNENLSLTTSSITAVQNQVTNNKTATEEALATSKSETEAAIATSKEETEAAIAASKEETEKQISENKEYTDAAIEELQTNVLYYEYDEETNTLHLFSNPAEEGEITQ